MEAEKKKGLYMEFSQAEFSRRMYELKHKGIRADHWLKNQKTLAGNLDLLISKERRQNESDSTIRKQDNAGDRGR